MRSDADRMAGVPLEVKLGEKTYKIKPLPIKASREWRGNLDARIPGLRQKLENGDVDPRTLVTSAMALIGDFSDSAFALLMAYAPELPEQEIIETATDEQVAFAFGEVLLMAFPFAYLIGQTILGLERLQAMAEIAALEQGSTTPIGGSVLET